MPTRSCEGKRQALTVHSGRFCAPCIPPSRLQFLPDEGRTLCKPCRFLFEARRCLFSFQFLYDVSPLTVFALQYTHFRSSWTGQLHVQFSISDATLRRAAPTLLLRSCTPAMRDLALAAWLPAKSLLGACGGACYKVAEKRLFPSRSV